MNPVYTWIGRRLAAYLARDRHVHSTSVPFDTGPLTACLRAGDVLLVEGHSKFSAAIKYLTQSTWSHAALYVGEALGRVDAEGESLCFVEADVVQGVREVTMRAFAGMHVRVCRPVGLNAEDIAIVIGHVAARLGHRYDLKNIVDLVRYLLPIPPVPQRFRRRMLAIGSGDPTRAICSTLVAEAFQAVRYPVLPIVERRPGMDPLCPDCIDEILHVRHHSLFVPRDFDVSPYFQVLKPSIADGFDYRALRWHDDGYG